MAGIRLQPELHMREKNLRLIESDLHEPAQPVVLADQVSAHPAAVSLSLPIPSAPQLVPYTTLSQITILTFLPSLTNVRMPNIAVTSKISVLLIGFTGEEWQTQAVAPRVQWLAPSLTHDSLVGKSTQAKLNISLPPDRDKRTCGITQREVNTLGCRRLGWGWWVVDGDIHKGTHHPDVGPVLWTLSSCHWYYSEWEREREREREGGEGRRRRPAGNWRGWEKSKTKINEDGETVSRDFSKGQE